MKEYVKPIFECVELKTEERLAGSMCSKEEIKIGSCPAAL